MTALIWNNLTLLAVRHLTILIIYVLALHGTTPRQRPAILRALGVLHRNLPESRN